MTEAEPHRRQPTDEEKFAAAGAEDYLGVPISDEELADVWTSQPDHSEPDNSQPDGAQGDPDKPSAQDEPG
jgi:hypothetical protein